MSCEQFPEGSRRRAICEGTAGLSLAKVNAFRAAIDLAPLDAVSEPTSFPAKVYENAQRQAVTRSVTASAPCPACTPKKRIEHGPGTELKAILAAKGVPSCQACDETAQRMNELGPQGCKENLPDLVAEILPRALRWIKGNRPWVHALLPGVIEELEARRRIKGYIKKAITVFQAKQAQSTAGGTT